MPRKFVTFRSDRRYRQETNAKKAERDAAVVAATNDDPEPSWDHSDDRRFYDAFMDKLEERRVIRWCQVETFINPDYDAEREERNEKGTDGKISAIDLTTTLTKNIKMHAPLIFSSDHAVSDQCITMALHGGIGILHSNFPTPADQAAEVFKVKRHKQGSIPHCIRRDNRVLDLFTNQQKGGFTVAFVTANGEVGAKLLGVLTSKDIKNLTTLRQKNTEIWNIMVSRERIITANEDMEFSDVLQIFETETQEFLPIVNSKDELIRVITKADLKESYEFPKSTDDKNGQLMVGAAVKVDKNARRTVKLLVEAGVDVLVIESENNIENQVALLKWIKGQYKHVDVIARNVITKEQSKLLIAAGADAVCVGMGSDSICTTQEAKAIAHYVRAEGIPIIADGGIYNVDNIIRTLALGASAITMDFSSVNASDVLSFLQDSNFAPDDGIKAVTGVNTALDDLGILHKFIPSLIQMIQNKLQKMSVRSLFHLHAKLNDGMNELGTQNTLLDHIPSFEEHCRIDPDWDIKFDENIYQRKNRWYRVDFKHAELFKKTDCSEEEAAQKATFKKAAKEKCMEFMKDAFQVDRIGAGTFGEVWTMRLNEDSPLMVQKISRCIDSVASTICEINFLCYINGFDNVNSEYLPQLVYSGYTTDGRWCSVMQYFSGGTLDYHIHEEIKREVNARKINREQKKYIAYHLALAIEYLHYHHYTHGDLKPNNIVLTKDGDVRLIDFGHTSNLLRIPHKKELPLQVAQYSSPEVWKQQPAGLASDWWSYGVIIAFLYQLRLPFVGKTKEVIQEHAQTFTPNIEGIQPQSAKELVSKLLVSEDARPKKVSTDKLFDTVRGTASKTTFKPGLIKYTEDKPSKVAEFVTDDLTVYDMLEAEAIRIPTSEFLASNTFKSL